jgi:hypothetical protein
MLNGDRAKVRQWIVLVQEPIRNLMIFNTTKFSCFTSRDVTLSNIENLILKANSEFNGFGGADVSCFGVLVFMKSQTPSTTLQINYKFQYPMTKTCLELSYFKMM